MAVSHISMLARPGAKGTRDRGCSDVKLNLGSVSCIGKAADSRQIQDMGSLSHLVLVRNVPPKDV